MSKRIAVLMGTRPECLKLAPVVRELRSSPRLEATVINTGQHREMLDDLLSPLDLAVDWDLAAMRPGQGLAALTSRLLEAVDAALRELAPSFALVQGDTTTVLASTLACFYRRIPVGHVEAGLRTGDLAAPFPEEANRVVAGQLAALHFAPTEGARANLLREGIPEERVVVTGNTGIDALLFERDRQRDPTVAAAVHGSLTDRLGPGWGERPLVVVTAHRRESFGPGFDNVCAALREIAARFPEVLLVFPVHANPNIRGPAHERLDGVENIALVPPLPYAEMVALLERCRLVLTDSGGMQEEAPALGKPVLVLRERTERPEGVAQGVARVVGLGRERIVGEVSRMLDSPARPQGAGPTRTLYGDGGAARRIVGHVERYLEGRRSAGA